MRKRTTSSWMKLVGFSTISISALFLVYLVFFPRPFCKHGFRNLQEMQTYAKEHEELVKTDTDNTLKPVFDNFYKRYEPTFALRIREKVHKILSMAFIGKEPIFSASFFKTLIDDLGKQRVQKQLSGNLVEKVDATENSKFIIFGNIQGAFHSLVRGLTELKNQGIIDDSLKIVKPDHYMIFMGDVINRSPYTMEALAAVARLLQVNEEKVIYLRGNHESKNYWQEHILKRELQVRAAHLSHQTLPLETEVNQFFDTLPLGLYIGVPGTTNDFIRISDAGRRESKVLQEHNFSQFLMTKNDKKSSFVVKEVSEGTVEERGVQIKAIIRGEKKRESFQKMEGLRFLAPDMDSVAWNILSCPTFVYQKALKFFYDAFVIVSAGKNLNQWLITLYRRDMRTKDPFQPLSYYLMTGIDTKTNIKMEVDRPKPKQGEVQQPTEKPASASVQQPTPVVTTAPAPTQQPPTSVQLPAPVQQPAPAPAEQTPPVSKKLVKEYLIEKVMTPEQAQEAYEKILTQEQREIIQKKLSEEGQNQTVPVKTVPEKTMPEQEVMSMPAQTEDIDE
ncbi:MAG: metallophosphoesterase [bacterium]